jgi:RNA polymerase sigma-70 factor, ECF subfamily
MFKASAHPGGFYRPALVRAEQRAREWVPQRMKKATVSSVGASPGSEPQTAAVGSDRARLERVFRDHHALVWRTVRRLGATPEVAADMTQQAFLIAAERLAEIRPGCERSFVFTTALTLARTRHRREKRCELEDMDTRAGSGDRDSAMRHHYAHQLLDRVLSKMDAELVAVFALFELEGVSTVEMAELLDLPVGTVASRLRRAREQFRGEVSRLERAGEARGLR